MVVRGASSAGHYPGEDHADQEVDYKNVIWYWYIEQIFMVEIRIAVLLPLRKFIN